MLGACKNPFEPAPAPKVKATPTPEAPRAGTSSRHRRRADKPADSGHPERPAAAPGRPARPAAPAPEPKPVYEIYSLTVRFGDATSAELEKRNLPRLKALPSAEDPVLVYLGPGKDAKTAVFLLDEGVEVQGDGELQAEPAQLRDAPHARRRHRVPRRHGRGRQRDRAVPARPAEHQDEPHEERRGGLRRPAPRCPTAGRRVVRVPHGRSGPLRYRYDAKSGTVRKIPTRAYKALLAKSARVALGTAGGF